MDNNITSLPAAPHAATSHLMVNLSALCDNWQRLDSLSSNSCQTAAVVKANGYGLGMEAVSQALYHTGCRSFFVARLEEAINLNDAFTANEMFDAKIYVLDGIHKGDESAFHHYSFIPVCNDAAQIARAEDIGVKQGRPLTCVIHIDTAMSRLGLSVDEFARLAPTLASRASLSISYIMSHLACADDADHPLNHAQLARFRDVSDRYDIRQCLGNSGALFLGTDFHLDMTRPGLSLYGLAPDGSDQHLSSVFSWTTDILQIREVEAGTNVGYGGFYQTPHAMRLATVGTGYADGLLRHFAPHLTLHIAGKPCPIIGRISMDSCVIDVSHLSETELNQASQATILETSADAASLAAKTDTIAYEIMTNIGARVARHYHGGV